MKNKKLLSVFLAGALMLGMTSTAYAGQWMSDEKGRWWQHGDGTYPVSRWMSIDGDLDGMAENYYFDEEGYLVTDTVVDGLEVNSEGQSVVRGEVLSFPVASTWAADSPDSVEGYYLGDRGKSGVDEKGNPISEYYIYYGWAIKVIDENTIEVLSDQFENMQPTRFYKIEENVYGLTCDGDGSVDRIIFDGTNLIYTCSYYQMEEVFKK